jgi:hypothetical protein
MDIVHASFDDEKAVADMSNKMNTGTKGVLLVICAHIIAFGVAICIIVLATALFIDTTSCGALGRALPVLWGIIAVVFLTSVIVVGILAWKIVPNLTGRLVIMVVYGVAMLVSYVGIAFGLMVAFNC